jgi:hypothetical protein
MRANSSIDSGLSTVLSISGSPFIRRRQGIGSTSSVVPLPALPRLRSALDGRKSVLF